MTVFNITLNPYLLSVSRNVLCFSNKTNIDSKYTYKAYIIKYTKKKNTSFFYLMCISCHNLYFKFALIKKEVQFTHHSLKAYFINFRQARNWEIKILIYCKNPIILYNQSKNKLIVQPSSVTTSQWFISL